jgi:hypothetical protein
MVASGGLAAKPFRAGKGTLSPPRCNRPAPAVGWREVWEGAAVDEEELGELSDDLFGLKCLLWASLACVLAALAFASTFRILP